MEIGGKVTYKIPKYHRHWIPRSNEEVKSKNSKIVKGNSPMAIQERKKKLIKMTVTPAAIKKQKKDANKIAVRISSKHMTKKKMSSKKRKVNIKISK